MKVKQLLSLVLAAGMLTSCAAGTGETGTSDMSKSETITEKPTEKETDAPAPRPEKMKVLACGHSNIHTSVRYLTAVSHALGTDMTVGLVWRGDSTFGTYTEMYNTPDRFIYEKSNDSEFENAKKVSENTYLDDLADDDWDVIVINQGFLYSGYPDSRKHLPEFLRIIRSVRPDTPVYHNLGLAYADGCPNKLFAEEYHGDTGKMFDTIITDVKDNIMTDPGISGLVPTGTLIRSLMTSEFRSMIYVSDGVHLGVYGSYAAAVIWYAVLTGASVDSLEWMPEGVSEQFRELVKSLVPKIIADPYTVIDLGHGGDAVGGEIITIGAAQSAAENDGGYFAKFNEFVLTPNGQDGLDVSMTGGVSGRCIWAFSDAAVSEHPILNYSLWNDGITAIRITGVWNDGNGDIDLPVDPGSHSIDIAELLSGRERSGMTYISVYTASAEPVPIAHFCLMKTKAE